MAIEFKIQDFFHPFEILRLKHSLDRSQWFNSQQLKEHQSRLLTSVITHAYTNVPYYRKLFDSLALKPKDISNAEDLNKIPLLTKDDLRKNFQSLVARNARQFNPKLCRTSGTSGEPVEFYQDYPSNILEFCYYWRYWSWAGYQLGSPFAEFTLYHFMNDAESSVDYSPVTNRLMLNPAQLSKEKIGVFLSAIRKYKPCFLKGSPSSIFIFAGLMNPKDADSIRFKAIFTTGELLLSSQRKKIEETFHCKILDSYGHMERTVAICQCPSGRYHIHSDYGVLEHEAGRLVGTSLYNMAMPLIRYEINDTIEAVPEEKLCECGRGLPLCEKITGRTQDIIVTPDGRFLSNIFILFDILQGVLWCQIIQEDLNKITVKIVKGEHFLIESEQEFLGQLQQLLGQGVRIEMEYVSRGLMPVLLSRKHKPVISNLKDSRSRLE